MDRKNSGAVKICFMGANQAGIISLLALLAKGVEVLSSVSYSPDLTGILNMLGITVYASVTDERFIKELSRAQLLFSVHAREIVRPELLKMPQYCCVNIHPYLYKYKGACPVARALEDKEFKASVGAHIMEEAVDTGKVLCEEFVDVSGANSAEEVYNKLYPYYCTVALKTLEVIRKEYEKA